MRILYDTNILVAVFARREATLRFKQEMTQRGIEHVSSSHKHSNEYIVTADKDLLVLKAYKGIAIIRPSDFAEIIRRR